MCCFVPFNSIATHNKKYANEKLKIKQINFILFFASTPALIPTFKAEAIKEFSSFDFSIK